MESRPKIWHKKKNKNWDFLLEKCVRAISCQWTRISHLKMSLGFLEGQMRPGICFFLRLAQFSNKPYNQEFKWSLNSNILLVPPMHLRLSKHPRIGLLLKMLPSFQWNSTKSIVFGSLNECFLPKIEDQVALGLRQPR